MGSDTPTFSSGVQPLTARSRYQPSTDVSPKPLSDSLKFTGPVGRGTTAVRVMPGMLAAAWTPNVGVIATLNVINGVRMRVRSRNGLSASEEPS